MELKLLGPVEITGPRGPVFLRGRVQPVLLALLGVRANRVVSTADLVAGLWGDDPPPTALKTTHGHIARLRRQLEQVGAAHMLATRDPGYVLAIEPVAVDAFRFEQQLRAGKTESDPREARTKLETALALWRGDALLDCRDRSEVLATEAVRLEELKLVAIEELVHLDLQLGHHADRVGDLESLVARYPLRERLWGALMLALYRSQRQGDALRAYQRAREMLVNELGVEPGDELRRLESAMLERDPSLEVSDLDVTTRGRKRAKSRFAIWVASGAPFVGRDDECRTLRDALECAERGDAQLVLVHGDAGIGKTRLAAELAVDAGQRGACTLYGRCDEGLGVPYQPFVDALRSYIDDYDDAALEGALGRYAGELSRLLPDLNERIDGLRPPLESDPATEQYRLFDAVVEWLRAASHDAPLVLVLDDVHWAARPTVLLLRHIARSHDLGRVLIIATCRSAEADATDALADVMADLRTGGTVVPTSEITLFGLDEGAVARFIGAATGMTHDAQAQLLVSAVLEYTAGNPFFVNEIVRDNEDVLAALRSPRPRPQVRLDLHVPAAARDVVMRRVTRLSAHAQRVLAVASIIGADFRLDVLDSVVDIASDALLDALDEVIAARLIEELGRDRYSFAHAIVRRAVYEHLSESRRRRLHRTVGEAIEQVDADRIEERLPELVDHFSRSDVVKAIRYSIAGAQLALDRLAFEDSVRMCERGLEAVEQTRASGHDVDRTQHCDLLVTLGRAELRSGEPRGRATLLRAYDIARTIGDPARQASAVLALNRGFFARVGRVDRELVSTLEDAIAAQPQGTAAATAELMATLASELVWSEDGDRRFGLSDQAIETARIVDDPRTTTRVLLLRSMTTLAPDNLAERLQESDELLDAAERLGDPALLFDAAFSRSGTAWEGGDVEQADRMEELATRLAHDSRQPRLVWQASFMRTSRLILEGALADAEQAAHNTLELGRRAHQDGEAFIFFTEQMLEIRRWQGRISEMLDGFADLAGDPRIDFGYSLVRYLYDAGEHERAHKIYERLKSETPLPPRRDMLALPILYNLAYLAARLGDREYSERLFDQLLPYARSFAHTTVAKPVGAHFLGMLAAVLGRDDTEAHFAAALRAHERCKAPLLGAATQVEAEFATVVRGMKWAEPSVPLEDVRAVTAKFGADFLTRRCDELFRLEPDEEV